MTAEEMADWLLGRLPELYPDAQCELFYRSPWELLVATVLSAQCTDKRVNQVTPGLFERLPRMRDFAEVSQEELEGMIHSTGFFRNKAKNLRACAHLLLEEWGGEVPRELGALASLPGVGRKTANVVLGNAFGINEGMVVDTHIGRLSQRLGLSKCKEAKGIERDLMRLFPRDSWKELSHWLISHGRAICGARKPKCGGCSLARECPKVGVEGGKKKTTPE